MLIDKPKKYKGIKFLKVEQQLFNNAKKYKRKTSSNSNSINNKSSSNDNNGKVFLKSSLNYNQIITDGEKTPPVKNNIIKKTFKRINSCNKKDDKKCNELVAISKITKKKEEEKNDKEMLLNRFSKANLKPLRYNKSFSCKRFFNQPINNNNNSNSISNNINSGKNNIYKYKSDNNATKKTKINNNDKNNKENNSNNKTINLNAINTNKVIGNENRENNCKKNKLKNFFCCL